MLQHAGPSDHRQGQFPLAGAAPRPCRFHRDQALFPEGALTGELRLAGLFSAAAYNQSSKDIPFLRHKAEQVFQRLGYGPNSYSGRVLTNVLETFPRDELFQISNAQLTEIAEALVRLELMPRTRVFIRRDEFGRFASILVYVMRERFTTEVRQKIIALLENALDAKMSEFTPVFTIGPLVRLHVVVWKEEGAVPDVSADDLETQVEAIVRTWGDGLRDMIRAHYGRGAGSLLEHYGQAFPPRL
ncbi:MAG: NAD-glutamate dehydrogenase [Rhodomicrobium sp.]|nr:NAD-glutamate dehydrogenase [Rhodomicrobium sp.]